MNQTKTELLIEYAERTWDFELPDDIEGMLEDDYVINSYRYTNETFHFIITVILISPDIKPKELKQDIREYWSNT